MTYKTEVRSWSDGAELCKNALSKAMIMLDGCLTCLNCGESKKSIIRNDGEVQNPVKSRLIDSIP